MQILLKCRKVIHEEVDRYRNGGFSPAVHTTAELQVLPNQEILEGTKFIVTTVDDVLTEKLKLGLTIKIDIDL